MGGNLDNRHVESRPRKFFRCGSEDHLIAKLPKPPIKNEKWRKQVRFNKGGDRASQKECDNGKNNNDKKIYAYMARMSDNEKCPSRKFCNSSQLTNWILDS